MTIVLFNGNITDQERRARLSSEQDPDIPMDATLTYGDVELPPWRPVDRVLEAESRLTAGVPPGLAAKA